VEILRKKVVFLQQKTYKGMITILRKKLKSFGMPNEYETFERFYCGY
jgi:hypothetical protein